LEKKLAGRTPEFSDDVSWGQFYETVSAVTYK
jgi:hypothetical protein